MSSISTALAISPSKVRSRITNDPAQRHGRSAEARRVRDLFAAYSAALGNPVDIGTQALLLAGAEAVTIAEVTRASHLAGKSDLDGVIRAEGAAARALRRLGLNRAAPPAKRRSFAETLAEAEAARRAAEARPVADAAGGDDVAADVGQLASERGSQADDGRARTISPADYDLIKQLAAGHTNGPAADGNSVGDGT